MAKKFQVQLNGNPLFSKRKYTKSGLYTKAAKAAKKEAAGRRRVLARGAKAAKHAAKRARHTQLCGAGKIWRKEHTRRGKTIAGKCVKARTSKKKGTTVPSKPAGFTVPDLRTQYPLKIRSKL